MIFSLCLAYLIKKSPSVSSENHREFSRKPQLLPGYIIRPKNCTIQILKTMVDLCIFMPGKWRFLSKGCVCIVLNKTSIFSKNSASFGRILYPRPGNSRQSRSLLRREHLTPVLTFKLNRPRYFSLWLKNVLHQTQIFKTETRTPSSHRAGTRFIFKLGPLPPASTVMWKNINRNGDFVFKNLFFPTSWANWHFYTHIPLQF
jgi:hypothetical protein